MTASFEATVVLIASSDAYTPATNVWKRTEVLMSSSDRLPARPFSSIEREPHSLRAVRFACLQINTIAAACAICDFGRLYRLSTESINTIDEETRKWTCARMTSSHEASPRDKTQRWQPYKRVRRA
jgi:hypothetical protein